MNITVIVIVALIAVALIVFMIVKNKRDRKKLLPPEDVMETEIRDQERKKTEL